MPEMGLIGVTEFIASEDFFVSFAFFSSSVTLSLSSLHPVRCRYLPYLSSFFLSGSQLHLQGL